MLERLIGLGRARPKTVLALVLLLAAACAALALTLQPSAGVNTLVPSSSADYQATQQDARAFGDAAVVVMVRGPLQNLVGSENLGTVSELEACLGGQEAAKYQSQVDPEQAIALVPLPAKRAKPYGGATSPCGHLMATRPAQVVYGPGTFLNQMVVAVDAQIPKTSPAELKNLASQLGITSLPSLDNSQFIDDIVFGHPGGGSAPKPRFSSFFPSDNAALIQVRLKPGLSSAQQASAIHWIRAAVQMPQFRLAHASYLVSGEPVVLNDLSTSLTGQVIALLAGAVVVMALVLVAIFRRRLRLLPLGLALAAAALTFGLCALAGGTLTMASIAVLPILIGLAVDYGVQFQSRASSPATIAAAALATATGFLVLLLSPVPMVQGFGLLLVVGVVVAFGVVLLAGSAALAVSGPTLGSAPTAIVASVRGAGEILADAVAPLRRRLDLERTLAVLTRRPAILLAAGLILAAGGWVLDTQTAVQSDLTKLVGSKNGSLQDLNTLERASGTSGELDVLVHAHNVATPATLGWMIGYEQRVAKHFGYKESTGCTAAPVCPAVSLDDLFASTTKPSQSQINGLLKALPSYFSGAYISHDRRYAQLALGIRLMPLARQRQVVAYLRSQLHPPRGISARLAGLPVLAADADGSLSSSGRRLLTLLAGLVGVGLVLGVVFRDPRRVLVPLAPIVLATGWSALIVFVLGIALNPMSASLGALVIAISTEFSVLLAERYRRERADGADLQRALAAAYRSTGMAVLCSGITAIAGFGVLIVSNVTMLSDFGLVTLIDLSVSLLGVLALLPAVLCLSESRTRVAA